MGRTRYIRLCICITIAFCMIFNTKAPADTYYQPDGFTNDTDISASNYSSNLNKYPQFFKMGLAGPGLTAWDYATGKGVNVAIIDCGADLYDRELYGNIKGVYNALTDSEEWSQVNSPSCTHGTTCAKILGAVGNNSYLNAGVAYNVNLYIVKAGDDGEFDSNAITKGIEWAARKKCRVVSMSFGGSTPNNQRNTLINELYNQTDSSILFVASAGNSGKEEYHYPASVDDVLSVSSLKYSNGAYSIQTNCTYNDRMDVAAPGGSTSAAAPYVAGVAALIFQVNPSLTAKECSDIITSTALDAGSKGYDKYYGHGIIQPLTAVQKAVYKTDSIFRVIFCDDLVYTKTDGEKSFNLNAKTIGSGILKYQSDNNKVATVSSNGTVSIKGPGIAFITVSIEKSGIFESAFHKVMIKVIPKTSTTSRPKRPTIKSVKKAGKKKIKISWAKNNKVSGYQIYISLNSKFKNQKHVNITKKSKTSKIISGLKKKKRYYIRMRSYITVNKKKVFSKYSKIKKIKL